ncbi:hypothetical protein Peur_033892 [Populus x canadensis]
MGKQNKSKKIDSLVKGGKVSPVQIAFIVDRYLSDNSLTQTRSIFRTEASSLISKSPLREKVILDRERVRLEQEKFRVQDFLHGMQDVMNAYNASANVTAPPATTPMIQASITRPAVMFPQADPFRGSPVAVGCPMHKSPGFPVSTPLNTTMEHSNLSSITKHSSTRKRMGSNAVAESVPDAKKSRSKIASRKIPSKATSKQCDNTATAQANVQPSPVIESSAQNGTPTGPIVQASGVAKSLFNQPLPSPPTSSSNPNTPPQAFCSQNDKSASPRDISANAHCSNNNTPQQVTPTNCTVITSERVTGRLDFDGSDAAVNMDESVDNELSASESDREGGIVDLDLPNLDMFGANFSFSELLIDLDLDCEGNACPCLPALAASADTISGSSHESRDGNFGTDQVMSEFSSTMTEVISGKDTHSQGSLNYLAVSRVAAKKQRSSLDQENCLASN